MATKPRRFEPTWYYHVFNCGVEKRQLFYTDYEYNRFIGSFLYYQSKQNLSYSDHLLRPGNPSGSDSIRVHIVAYCVMPNHFHFLLKPISYNGLSQFISDISNSLTRYFNDKYDRVGRLLQGPFKAKQIDSNQSLLQVSRYIHLNPVVSEFLNPIGILLPEQYPYSSYISWIYPAGNPSGSHEGDIKLIRNVVELAGGSQKYKSFVESKISKPSFSEIDDLLIEDSID